MKLINSLFHHICVVKQSFVDIMTTYNWSLNYQSHPLNFHISGEFTSSRVLGRTIVCLYTVGSALRIVSVLVCLSSAGNAVD